MQLTQEQKDKAMVAEFMGLVPVHCTINSCEKEDQNSECEFTWCGYSEQPLYQMGNHRWSHFSLDQLDYDTNWNSLIKACKNWDDLLFIEGKEEEQVKLCNKLDNAVTIYEIEAAFKQLVENIKWYNANVPSMPADSLGS